MATAKEEVKIHHFLKLIRKKLFYDSKELIFGDLEHIVPYKESCLKCANYKNCTLYFLKSNVKNPRLDYIKTTMYEFNFIFNTILPTYGLKYTLKCGIQEILGILRKIILRKQI